MKDLIPYLNEKVEEYIIFSGLADSWSISKYSSEIRDTIKDPHKSHLAGLYIENTLRIKFGLESIVRPSETGLKILMGNYND